MSGGDVAKDYEDVPEALRSEFESLVVEAFNETYKAMRQARLLRIPGPQGAQASVKIDLGGDLVTEITVKIEVGVEWED